MKNTIYISYSMSVPEWYLNEISEEIKAKSKEIVVGRWRKGSFYGENETNFIKKASAMVVALPDNLFSIRLSNLTAGVAKEIKLATESNVPLYLAYKLANGDTGIYEASILDNTFKGISGTKDSIFKTLLLSNDNLSNFYTVDKLKSIKGRFIVCKVESEQQWTTLKKAGFYMTSEYYEKSIYYFINNGCRSIDSESVIKIKYPDALFISFSDIVFDSTNQPSCTHTNVSQYNRNILLII